jgi:hypothetical protein
LKNGLCIDKITIAHTKEGYSNSRYDAEFDIATKKYNPDIGTTPTFHFTPNSQSGDLYISVDLYPAEVVPAACTSGTYTNANLTALNGARTRPVVYFGVFKESQSTSEVPFYGYKLYQADYTQFIIIPEANYTANQKI